MRHALTVVAALSCLGADCPAPAPPVPQSGVYFDSGAVLRLRLRDRTEISGTLLEGAAPGVTALALCDQHTTGCSAADTRMVPMGEIEEVRYRSNAKVRGATAGLYAGMLTGLVIDTTLGLFVFTGLTGAVAGWFVGSAVTTWPRVATRDGERLLWEPGPMIIPEPRGRHEFATGCARGDSAPRADLVAVVHWTRRPFSTDVDRAWRVDTVARRLIPVSTEGIRCRNKSWFELAPKDRRRAPAESVSAALTFAVTPDKARVYLYHVSAYIMDPFVITLDHKEVGPLRYDRYVTVELDPGRHRLGALSTRDSVTFDTQADRVYFFKVMPGSWRITGTLFTAEMVKEAEGRKLIAAADLMPWADTAR